MCLSATNMLESGRPGESKKVPSSCETASCDESLPSNRLLRRDLYGDESLLRSAFVVATLFCARACPVVRSSRPLPHFRQWYYSPEEAKASHPILRVSSSMSIRPRREWDASAVEVLPGDLEDDDTPRGGTEEAPVRIWKW